MLSLVLSWFLMSSAKTSATFGCSNLCGGTSTGVEETYPRRPKLVQNLLDELHAREIVPGRVLIDIGLVDGPRLWVGIVDVGVIYRPILDAGRVENNASAAVL